MRESKQHIQKAWEVVVERVKSLDDVNEICEVWSDFTDMLEAYAKEARDRRDLHDTDHSHTHSDLRFAAMEALAGLAVWKITDEREQYKEVGETLRFQLNRSHDLLFRALSP